MTEKRFMKLGEQEFFDMLPNGLRIYYYPKPGFSKTFAALATNFGSVDESFTLGGVRYDTPTGIAHFLEHKMFEDEDGNALQKFAATGANPNAFTSHVITAYHFSCTEAFEKNLEILLKFVFTPYFTPENVEKERGIIGQEIGMMDDTPGWQAMVQLYEGLYQEHPVRRSIAGSVESISKIDSKLLYMCHKAFYSPSNMALVVVGEADFESICRMAKTYSPAQSTKIGERHYGKRRDKVAKSEISRKMAVSMPTFMLGFKDEPLQRGDSRMKRTILGDIAVQLLCGKTSPLYARLYEKRLINACFDVEYDLFPEAGGPVFAGESRDPRVVREAIEDEISVLAREGIDEALFTRVKNACYGMTLRALDAPEELARLQLTACFGGEDFLNFPLVFQSITAQDVQQMLAHWARPERSTLSVIHPLD